MCFSVFGMFQLLLFLLPLVSGLDPEIRMTVPEIIARWEYPVETHRVTTEDGYILTLHRIPHGEKNRTVEGTRRVVFLQHGLLASSSTWITNLPHLSLGFFLADAGFDVWMGNSRGNIYSKSHTTMSTESEEFWQFSWQDMAQYDLEASVNYVLIETNQTDLDYIGHSQGTLIMFSKLAEDEAFNKKIRQFHALAPIVSVGYIQGTLKRLAWLGADTWVELLDLAEQLQGDSLLTDIFKGPCNDAFGQNQRTQYEPAEHVQIATDMYPKIATDMYLYWSDFDALANKRDITEHLLPRLSKQFVKGNYRLNSFNHVDFVWGDLAAELIYETMIRTLKTKL